MRMENLHLFTLTCLSERSDRKEMKAKLVVNIAEKHGNEKCVFWGADVLT